MNIIVHCKNIVWDVGEDALNEFELPEKHDVKLNIETDVTLQSNMTLSECIDEHLDSKLASILSDIYGFRVADASYTWELDPADLLKTLKESAKHTLTKWKAAYREFKADKITMDDYFNYLKWMQENLTDVGLIGETDSLTGEPISISARLTP